MLAAGTYATSDSGEHLEPPRFAYIDTLFSLAEAYLYALLVDMKDDHSEGRLRERSYWQLYDDVKGAIDLCHRDMSIKREVNRDPSKYIHQDPKVEHMLKKLKQSGKLIFLVTNSLWDYTNVVMNHVIRGKSGNDRDHDWTSLFDCLIVGARKPEFFSEDAPKDIFEVDLGSGNLRNTLNGAPLTPIGEEPGALDFEAFAEELKAKQSDKAPKVFQGGNFRHLHAKLGITSSTKVLYCGDHVYGDVLASKKSLGWRTLLVVPELAHEVRVAEQLRDVPDDLLELRVKREKTLNELEELWPSSSTASTLEELDESTRKKVDGLQANMKELKKQHREKLKEYHEEHNPWWGALLKTGYQHSRFGSQIERFACLYTDAVTNLAQYVSRPFRAIADRLPHEERNCRRRS